MVSCHESAHKLTDGKTERRKHGADSITSTADAGGKNDNLANFKYTFLDTTGHIPEESKITVAIE